MSTHPDAERWNGRYQTEGQERQKAKPSLLLQAYAHLLPNKGIVLDAAAGVGVNARFVARLGLQVVALDISEVGLRLLQTQAAAENLRIDTAVFDLTSPYFPPSCAAAILNFRFLERAAFSAYRQALRPGGLLLFETFVHLGAEEAPPYFLQPGELARAFTDFDQIHAAETAVSGQRSGKMRHVAQLVARKPAA